MGDMFLNIHIIKVKFSYCKKAKQIDTRQNKQTNGKKIDGQIVQGR